MRQSPSQFADGRREIIQLTKAAGRDPSGLHYSITLPLRFSATAPGAPVQDRTALTGTDDDIAETVRAYQSAGLDEIVVSVSTADLDRNTDAMSHFMQLVWPKL